MEKNLVDMFKGLNESYKSLESRLKAEGFKVRIMKIFRTWEEWAVYGRDFLIKLQNTFLGLSTKETKDDGAENVDGVPLSDKEDEDLDGIPLDGAALLKGALMRGIPTPERDEHSDYDDDIDGVPCKYQQSVNPSFDVIYSFPSSGWEHRWSSIRVRCSVWFWWFCEIEVGRTWPRASCTSSYNNIKVGTSSRSGGSGTAQNLVDL